MNLRYLRIVLKGRKILLKKIKKRQMYERFLKIAQDREPFLYSHMTPKEFTNLVNVSQFYLFNQILKKNNLL